MQIQTFSCLQYYCLFIFQRVVYFKLALVWEFTNSKWPNPRPRALFELHNLISQKLFENLNNHELPNQPIRRLTQQVISAGQKYKCMHGRKSARSS